MGLTQQHFGLVIQALQRLKDVLLFKFESGHFRRPPSRSLLVGVARLSALVFEG
jgi:hypothetical protein